MIAEIVIGKPLVTAEEIGFDNPIYTEERFLPKLLVSLGKSHLWLLVGE